MPACDQTGLRTEIVCLLWAARETGVLDALTTSAGTPEEIAAETGIAPEAAEPLVELLAKRGFLTRVADGYEPTTRLLGFIARQDIRSLGRLPHALHLFDALVDLPRTLRDGKAPPLPDDWTLTRLGWNAATDDAVIRARVTAAVRIMPSARRVLDLAGGAGVHAREFAARGYDVTLLDSPDVIDLARPLIDAQHGTDGSEDGGQGSIELHSGPPSAVEDGFDLAFVSGGLAEMGVAEANWMLSRVADVLLPDGALVVTDVPDSGSEEATAAAVHGLALGEGGGHTVADCRSWLTDAGLANVTVEPVPSTPGHAVAGRRQ